MLCMSTYAISDIHGCFDEFEKLLEMVDLRDDDELYILGDLIDRGPQIDRCAEWLVRNGANEKDSHVHFLMGNHEEMATWAFEGAWSKFEFDDVYLPSWELNGGAATLRQLRTLPAQTVDAFQRIVSRAPKAATLTVGGELILLCHAGIRPAEPEAEDGEWLIQSAEDLMWIGLEWYCAEEQPPFHVISGHTPVIMLGRGYRPAGCPPEVRAAGANGHMMHWGRKHDIDCGCVFGGNLGMLRLDDWQELYVAREGK